MQAVVITGASAGIGKEFARQLAAEGKSLVLVARRLDRLETLAAELRERHAIDVVCIASDLAQPHAPAELAQALEEQQIAVTGLINNAGLVIGDSLPTRICSVSWIWCR